MKMRVWIWGLILGLLPLSALHAQAEKPILRKKPSQVLIGDRWKVSRKKHRSANVTIYSIRDENDWQYIRLPSVDEDRSTYQTTVFPIATANDVYFDLQVLVTISGQGKVTECRYDPDTPIEPEVKIDPLAKEHICPMLLKNVQFFHALNSKGEPAERKGVLSASYGVITQFSDPSAYPPPMATMSLSKARRPEPTTEITFETLGLTEQILKDRKIASIFATVQIGADGKPIRCLIGAATYDDAIDRQICAKTMALDFIPGTDENQTPRETQYYLMLFTDDIFVK
jgi:hypothetical protein